MSCVSTQSKHGAFPVFSDGRGYVVLGRLLWRRVIACASSIRSVMRTFRAPAVETCGMRGVRPHFTIHPGEIVGTLAQRFGETTTAGSRGLDRPRDSQYDAAPWDICRFRRRLATSGEPYLFRSCPERIFSRRPRREIRRPARRELKPFSTVGLSPAAYQATRRIRGQRQKIVMSGALLHDPPWCCSTSPRPDSTSRPR